MVLGAEESVLQLERHVIETLRNELLREQMEECDHCSLSRITEDDAALMELSGPLGVRRIRLDDPLRIN